MVANDARPALALAARRCECYSLLRTIPNKGVVMYVCSCCGLTDADIRKAGAERRHAGFDAWSEDSGCGTVCESCGAAAKALFEGTADATNAPCACGGHCTCAVGVAPPQPVAAWLDDETVVAPASAQPSLYTSPNPCLR